MKIQSLSIVIPTKRCINDCPFCVSKMHDNEYENSGYDNFQISKRLKYAINNGVNSIILTGTGEPLQNKKFLANFRRLLDDMDHPFPNIELQTTGILLDKLVIKESLNKKSYDFDKSEIYPNLDLLQSIGVNTINLSVSNIFDDDDNMDIIGVPKHSRFKLANTIKIIKSKGFNVRLSLNMTDVYSTYTPKYIIERCKALGADQITFRKLYQSGNNTPEDLWVELNSCEPSLLKELDKYIYSHGDRLYQLPFGPIAFSINGMSTVLDNDCMGKSNENSLKYLILREDGKLYCRWDDKGSLIF